MGEQTVLTPDQEAYNQRVQRVETAIALKEPDRVPVVPFIASYAQRAYGSCYADLYYNYEKAGDAAVQFYKDHPQMDVSMFSGFTSGRANELAGSQMIDWPGRPGTMESIVATVTGMSTGSLVFHTPTATAAKTAAKDG